MCESLLHFLVSVDAFCHSLRLTGHHNYRAEPVVQLDTLLTDVFVELIIDTIIAPLSGILDTAVDNPTDRGINEFWFLTNPRANSYGLPAVLRRNTVMLCIGGISSPLFAQRTGPFQWSLVIGYSFAVWNSVAPEGISARSCHLKCFSQTE